MDDSYSYKDRRGFKQITWGDFYGLCKGLAGPIAEYNPDIIVGVARGGLYPATQLSHLLQKELYTVRLTRRINDKITHENPIWIQKPTELLKNKKILIVDELCETGQTLSVVKNEIEDIGAKEIRIAVLYSHTKAQEVCQYIGVISDKLIINPWDIEILADGQFVLHPEYKDALNRQNIAKISSLLPTVKTIRPSKF